MSTNLTGARPWRPVIYDGYCESLAEAAETFFRIAVEPACSAVALELELNPRGPDNISIARWESLRSTQLELHRSFALALGGLWERHFQRHLEHSLSVLGPKEKIGQVEKANWDKLCSLFKDCRGFELIELDSYENLRILNLAASAVRHGNGNATRKLFDARPDLFAHQPVRDFFSYVALGGEPTHSIHRLDISFLQLEIFRSAIADFWRAIAELRSASAS